MSKAWDTILGFLRSQVLPADLRAARDDQLLRRFTMEHDQGAFAALMCRHAPMVWCTCRRMLANDADAEDAFQATFLVLARKARSLLRRDLLAGWLHGVAYRTSKAARVTAARRQKKETTARALMRAQRTEEDSWADLRPLLDHELALLPDKYRTAIILCDLQGKSRQETARLLRISEGTLSSRLARGRRILAERLSRYAPAVSGGALAAYLATEASAAVPTPLIASTLKSATAVLGAGSASAGLSSSAAALTEGVLKMMFLTRLKTTAAVLFAAVLLCTGAGLLAGHMFGADPATNNELPAKILPAEGGKPKQPEQAKADRPKDADAPLIDRIQPGVRLSITAVQPLPGQPIKGIYRVEATGKVSLGFSYGRVLVAGLTLEQAEQKIRNHLDKMLNDPDVSVTQADLSLEVRLGHELERRVQDLEKQVRELQASLNKLRNKR